MKVKLWKFVKDYNKKHKNCPWRYIKYNDTHFIMCCIEHGDCVIRKKAKEKRCPTCGQRLGSDRLGKEVWDK